jgi:uncharacterized membrane protein
MPIAKAIALHSTYFDLGIFESVSFNLEEGGGGSPIFSAGHVFGYFPIFTFFSKFIQPGFRGLFLIASQSFFLVMPIFYLYRRFGIFSAFVYITYSPVWSNALFDFHFDHLSVPILLCFYLAFLDKKIIFVILSAVMLMFIKEVFALQTIACGIMLLVAAFSKGDIWSVAPEKNFIWKMKYGGLLLVGVGFAYFIFSTHYLIPYFSYSGMEGFHGGGSFGWLGGDLRGMILTLLFDPHIVLGDIISTHEKLIYLGVIFGSLGFISLLSPVLLIPALPLLLVAILSHTPNHYDHNSHYTAGVIIPVIFSFCYGFLRAEQIFIKYLESTKKYLSIFKNKFFLKINFKALICIWVILGSIFLSSSPISRLFWSSKIWSVSLSAYIPTERDRIIKEAMIYFIPTDPKVSIATQNTINWSHLSRREYYFSFPGGVFKPEESFKKSNLTYQGFWDFFTTGARPEKSIYMHNADYVILDMKRPYFILDEGCNWIYGECQNKVLENRFLDFVSQTRLSYSTVFEYDGFEILRRQVK